MLLNSSFFKNRAFQASGENHFVYQACAWCYRDTNTWKKSNTASVEMGMGAVLSFCFSNQEEHQQRNFLIHWSLVPHVMVVLGAVTCEIGKAVKPGKHLPWSRGWELCLVLAGHKGGLDTDSEKPGVTQHYSLGSNLEHLTFCYICLVMFTKPVKVGLYNWTW